MREPQSAGGFDAALCFFGSFGYFSDAENLRCARAYATALREGGRLLIDTHVAESLLPRFAERDWIWSGTPGSSLRILQERRFDHENSRILGTWTLVNPDGGLETAHSSIRLYSYRELCELLRAAGFTGPRTGVETLTGQPFRVGVSRLSLIATK
jgi:hypothetical protein